MIDPQSAGNRSRPLAGFAILSLLAAISGAVTMASIGTPTIRWGPNLAAWGVGGLLALAIVRTRPQRGAWLIVAIGGAAAIAATLLGPDQLGVHRWLAIGPLSINAAGVVLPAVIVALARLGPGNRFAQAIAVMTAAIIALQPDASQAWGFVLACLAWLLPNRSPSVAAQALVLIGLAILATLSPDPLEPVAEVEQIISLALSVHPALAALAVTTLATLTIVFWTYGTNDRAARALALYCAVTFIAPVFGWFPVPLVGAGMSFPLGLWLGAALLATPYCAASTMLPLELPAR
ncbi:hypothetical protein [Blastomonas aquatica]|uniref:hypothetical protein n=1 Tax=Blastomonas aquatica TaxID=1510276 RepID=UPI0016654000|nr:hypothetical protein [Blastomonas aquatica]